MTRPPIVLTIAGSDSGAGAGVQADARTIHACGGFACMAITAVTAQSSRGVRRWRAEPAGLIAEQMRAVLEDLPVAAIKIGLLPGAAVVRAVVRELRRFAQVPVVVDPVIGASSGTQFLDEASVRALRDELLPCATLVTPNWPEAARLAGTEIRSFALAERAARVLARDLATAVLVKGGHAAWSEPCGDVLVTPAGRGYRWSASRIETLNTRGTGCVLSSAIAVALARGATLPQAVSRARGFLRRSLRRHRRDQWRGPGPAFPG
ncbi:MAG TPA: bifunctional hydroxymethylpyrimidine kinase/phosphomethylpyrimidine kinase [Candidatus Synoicihabitans sp.]|nr:bifunctional hydroxymethylpyrimidine kinase/phosphomethylpyrimidine kinase [Candidatus Synoicihabitans sp.]